MTAAQSYHMLTPGEEEEYEKVEQRIRRGVKYADTKCRKARMGKVPFSEKQKKLMGHVYILKQIWLRSKLRGQKGRPHRRKIARDARKYKYTGPLDFDSLQEIEETIKKAAEAYNQFRPKAHEFHQAHQEKLANEIALDSGRDPETVYKEIIHAAQTKEHFKNIRRKERRGERYGVDRVDIATADGLRTTVNKDEIEEAILKANKEKLLQAKTHLCEQNLSVLL